MSGDVYGIDLGTTYSAIAHINEAGLPEILKNIAGQDTTPSVVYFNSADSVEIGSSAKQIQVSDPDNACSLIKRHMGEEYRLDFFGRTHTPESISSLILKELVTNANAQHHLDINRVVITVPAYFGIQERQATRQAGVMAGLDVVGIVPEPVAAAINLGTRQDEEQTILIYDLGGGTFDTTILRARTGKVEVLAIDGNRLLGGADWDLRLEDLYLEKFISQSGLQDGEDPRVDEEFMTELRVNVEEAKMMLTPRDNHTMLMRYQDKKERVQVTREEFEAATSDLLAQTVEITRRVVATAQEKHPGLTIDRLLLVGGSSRMPMVENALRDAGFSPEKTDFDLSVAKGAAIFGQGEVSDYEFGDEASADAGGRPRLRGGVGGPMPEKIAVTNVLSRGVGVGLSRELGNGELEQYVGFLAHANEDLPLAVSMDGHTVRDRQTGITVPLYEQGGETESELPADNKAMASGESTTISGLPPLPKDSPVEINLEISTEGTATLVVVEPSTGKSFSAVAAVSVLSTQEVEELTELVAGITTRS